MQHSHQATGATSSIGGCPTSRASSPSSGGLSEWLPAILQGLARLETGQVLNRQAGEMRVESLTRHVDQRIADLRHDIGGRMDRIETRVGQVEMRPSAAPTMPGPASAGTETAHPAAAAPTPWWREMSLRELLTWALVLGWAFGLIPETVSRTLVEALVARLLPGG